LGKPFVDISNMTHDPPEGVVRFANRIDEIAYKMPHKIEQYNSLSDLEKEHTKSVYLRNEEDKRRGGQEKRSGVFSTWMEFGGNTRDLGSFGEETDNITDLHQIHEEVLFTVCGDGVAGIKRRRHWIDHDFGVKILATASGRDRLRKDIESSTWQRRQEHKATSSCRQLYKYKYVFRVSRV
nr:retrotransposon Orf1 [Tanacetum cinerariifolium]